MITPVHFLSPTYLERLDPDIRGWVEKLLDDYTNETIKKAYNEGKDEVSIFLYDHSGKWNIHGKNVCDALRILVEPLGYSIVGYQVEKSVFIGYDVFVTYRWSRSS